MIQYVPQDGFPRYVLYSISPICLSKKSSLHSNTKVSSEYRKPYLRIPNADQDIFATEKSCSKETQLTSFKSATPKGIWPGNPVLMKEKKKDQLSKEVVFFRPCLGNAVLEAEGEGKAPWWGAWRIPGGRVTARSEKRESGFPSLGSGAGGVLQAETTGSARVEVGRAGWSHCVLETSVGQRSNVFS